MFSITDKEFRLLSDFIKDNFGINLKEEKRSLVTCRLSNILAEHNFRSYTEYFEYLKADRTGNAVNTLIEKITTNHTFFMREPDHFVYFKDNILPKLIKTSKSKDLRIWSAGCSTGEEPYTLAMIINEYLGNQKLFWDSKILATDISNSVLDVAKKGYYRNESLTSLPSTWILNYFKNQNNGYSSIVSKIKNEVIFGKFNLMQHNFNFSKKFQVIFCRNVMIYFDVKTKETLLEKFYDCLEYGGYLIIGHSESINRNTSRFKYIKPAIYRKE